MKRTAWFFILFFIIAILTISAGDCSHIRSALARAYAQEPAYQPPPERPPIMEPIRTQERRTNNAWRGWPRDFNENIDAALNGKGRYSGKAYFFKGNQYFRYDWDSDQVDYGYPQKIKDNWPGFPRKFTRKIDAAVSGEGRSRGKAFFFRGRQYIRYDWDRESVDPGFPKNISGDWRGFPSEFNNNIDAILPGVGDEIDKVYFIKGDRFLRYDWNLERVDAGYPKYISEYWPDVPREFSSNVDAAFAGEGIFAGKVYFFKNNMYIRADINLERMDQGFPLPIGERSIGIPQGESLLYGKAYFFRDDVYIRHDLLKNTLDSNYPRRIEDGFAGWPRNFEPPIDTAVVGEGPFQGKVFFFIGDEYIRYDIAQRRVESGYPKRIAGNWRGLPADFEEDIDAAVSGQAQFRGKVFFFKGNEYIRYDWNNDRMDPGYPKPIYGNWFGFPYEFTQGIDCAINSVAYPGKVYFFKGARYIRYDWAADKMDPGFPLPVRGNWGGFPRDFSDEFDDAISIGR